MTLDTEKGTINVTGQPPKCLLTIVEGVDFLLKEMPHLIKSVRTTAAHIK